VTITSVVVLAVALALVARWWHRRRHPKPLAVSQDWLAALYRSRGDH
jgi:hypothetical protein